MASFVWLKIRALEERPVEISQSPPATFMVTSAAATLQFGGPAALKNLLELRERRNFSVLAVDEENREVLNREVAPTLLKQARQIAAERDVEAVREVKASDGHTYTLFLPAPIRGERGEVRNEAAMRAARPSHPMAGWGLEAGRMGPRDHRRPARSRAGGHRRAVAAARHAAPDCASGCCFLSSPC